MPPCTIRPQRFFWCGGAGLSRLHLRGCSVDIGGGVRCPVQGYFVASAGLPLLPFLGCSVANVACSLLFVLYALVAEEIGTPGLSWDGKTENLSDMWLESGYGNVEEV